jgi:predicted nucleic acid-binding protein
MVLATGRRERRVFVDTSAYLALLARNDQYHPQAAEIFQLLLRERAPQFTTNTVVIEAHALILSTLGIGPGQAFLRSIDAGGTTVVRSRASDEERAREIIYQYGDKDFSLTDAISFAVMERLHITRAFTFDHHFAQYGFTNLTPELL